MAKLYLKFEQAVLKEYDLKDGASLTIGRLPDNNIHIDNLAVSGHHARVVWETDHFVLEDNNSLNGTFVNNRRVSRVPLKHGAFSARSALGKTGILAPLLRRYRHSLVLSRSF